jgi:hydroxymethylbilane synthase
MTELIIGSRKSKLAQVQTRMVRQHLLDNWTELNVDIHFFDTKGDLNRTDPLPAIGGKGLFTLELENALREKKIDLAVHSLKDLPVEDSAGLTVVAIPLRAATHDLLVSRHATEVEALPSGAVVGTSSLRRAAQLLALRPDLKIKDIRGNVDTRLRKLDDPEYGYDAILLAQAGLNRLGHTGLDYAYPIPFELVLPAPGQGALGVQGRAQDPEIEQYMQPIEHAETRAAVTAERSFLAGLGGGCSIPVGALATVTGETLVLKGVVASPDGQQVIRVEIDGSITEAEALGQQLAQMAVGQGADKLLQFDS